MKKNALNYFYNGYFCSEAVIKSAADKNICNEDLLSCATAFAGGMSSGCLCGAVAAAQMIIGQHFGSENNAAVCVRKKAEELVQRFKERNKVTCCKILSGGLQGIQRKERCSKYVSDVCEILEDLLKVRV